MITQNTFGISFFIKKDKESNGTVPLFARITVNGLSKQLSLKRRVNISAWRQKEQRLDGNEQEDRDAREKMRQTRNKVNAAYDELIYRYGTTTAEEVKAKVEGNNESVKTLLWLIDYHNTGIGKTLTEGTMKNYRSTKKFVKEFLQLKIKKEDFPLVHVNHKFIMDFDLFLRLRKPDKGQRPCSNNTVMKHMERLRKITTTVGLKNGWIEKDPFEHYVRNVIAKDRECLTEEELKALTEVVPLKHGHAIVRDMFLFSCYTGLSYAEITRFSDAHITKDGDGEYWIEMTRRKTANSTERKFYVLLLPGALKLIEKYRNHPASLNHGTIFPYYCYQTINRYLKILAEAAGITKKVAFHVARHTFATTVTLENGVPIETVSEMLGHASIKTTQIYAKVKKRKVANDMKALKGKMHPQSQALQATG